MLATHLFGERNAEFFGSFHASFFTMIQVVSGDAWASIISRSIFEEQGAGPRLDQFAELLLGQALLAEGNPPPDPARFAKLVAELMAPGGDAGGAAEG